MKVLFPKSLLNETLYNCSRDFENLSSEALENLLANMDRDLDIVCERLRSGDYMVVNYEVLFYRGELEKQDFIGDFSRGTFSFRYEEGMTFSLPKFQRRYKEIFECVKGDFRERPGSLNVHALVIAGRDSVHVGMNEIDS